MAATTESGELSSVRRVFPTWSIEVPEIFGETFVADGNYWHAYTDDRSISLTSMQITAGSKPVRAAEILREMRKMFDRGESVKSGPVGLLSYAVFADAPKSGRASRLLSGLVASDGRALLVTITSDDLNWAQRIWCSIRRHGAPPGQISQALRGSDRSKRPR